jgi:hypothetical protein
MYDVFYSRKKPNCFPHEQQADDIKHAKSLSRTEFFWWITYLSDYSQFDFLYVPRPWESQYTHVWPSQHHDYSGTYLVPTHVTQIEYHFHKEIVPNRESTEHYHQLITADFDCTWAPHPHDPPYIYVFGNQWWPATTMPTVEYHVPGATERKYMNLPKAELPKNPNRCWYDVIPDCDWDYSWQPDPGDPPYIYVFGNQWWPAEKMPTIEYRVPGATERKYMSWPRAELIPSMNRWTVPNTLDVSDFDFSWQPDPGAPPYIYQFATQHQKTGGPVYTTPGAIEIKYLSDIRARTTRVATAIYEIDHMDGNAGHVPNTTRRVRYFDNYKDTLIRLAKSIGDEHEYVWVCSSICDYSEFDFSWHPEAWQSTMLHVFASNDQKFGDTFFMHVPTFAEYAEKKALLDWYDVNYVPNIFVPRRPIPVVKHTNDSHVDVVKTHSWTSPLTLFTVDDILPIIATVSLWRDKTKTIVPLNEGATSVIVPQLAGPYIKTQLYDYPYIDKKFKKSSRLQMDVIFISYDEPDADKNWKLLKNRVPRAVRIHGIKGMELALEAAADASTTPWYYAVFAKTELHENFDFSFVPDFMQQPKNYIFDCLNTVNQLQYGHMGIVMYNCRGVKQLNREKNFGLDYTLSFPHESIPILSCYGKFDQSPYHTWRTAFREAAKLSYFESMSHSIDGEYRLHVWQNKATGPYADWCIQGARDGVEFFNTVGQDLILLKQSFDWAWLRSYFVSKYGERE